MNIKYYEHFFYKITLNSPEAVVKINNRYNRQGNRRRQTQIISPARGAMKHISILMRNVDEIQPHLGKF